MVLRSLQDPDDEIRPSKAVSDAAVRATDDDAAHARLSAVRKGYLEDPFLTHLVPRAHLVPTRPPLINIGTFVRSEAIDSLVKGWVSLASSAGPVQIVSLGAGSDTRFWRLSSTPLKAHIIKYIELDFVDIITKKARAIQQRKALGDLLGPDVTLERDATRTKVLRLTSAVLNLIACDLNEAGGENLLPLLNILSPDRPTLVLAECVLPYLKQDASFEILRWFCSNFNYLGAITYEMFGLTDSFGETMVRNLKLRQVNLPGAFPTLAALQDRFTEAGFAGTKALTLKEIRASYIPRTELQRIATLEFLDEVEELELLLAHYTISWAYKAPQDSGGALQGWGLTAEDTPPRE